MIKNSITHRLLCVALILCSQFAFGQKTIVYCGQLIDVKANSILKEMSIIVEGNKIADVQKGYMKNDSGAVVIDLRNRTVMPGLIDMHVHLENETSKDALVKRFTQNEADIAFQSTIYAKKNLMAGFTTVRDCGGSGVNVALRNAVNAGTVIGPRIFAAGKSIATTGGHADPTNASPTADAPKRREFKVHRKPTNAGSP